jgi:hypothetical protein
LREANLSPEIRVDTEWTNTLRIALSKLFRLEHTKQADVHLTAV